MELLENLYTKPVVVYMSITTINDIAQELSNFESIVSHAPRYNPRIREELIRDIKNMALRMEYILNINASSLRYGKIKWLVSQI